MAPALNSSVLNGNRTKDTIKFLFLTLIMDDFVCWRLLSPWPLEKSTLAPSLALGFFLGDYDFRFIDDSDWLIWLQFLIRRCLMFLMTLGVNHVVGLLNDGHKFKSSQLHVHVFQGLMTKWTSKIGNSRAKPSGVVPALWNNKGDSAANALLYGTQSDPIEVQPLHYF